MRETLQAIDRMRKSLLVGVSQQSLPGPVSPKSIRPYTASIRLKLQLLDHHSRFLTNMEWEQLHMVGDPGAPDKVQIACGNNNDIVIELTTAHAGRMMILDAFDGVVAACVNAADTLARLLNLAYNLRVRHDHANLPRIYQAVSIGSRLKAVLDRAPGTKWMEPVRRLRGECQHCDLASVIEEPGRGFGVPPTELLVKQEYSLEGVPNSNVALYAETVRNRTNELLRNVAEIIASQPGSACAPGTD